jgi:hypothetical protein
LQMKKKVLFVSVVFPPKSDSEGLQTAKYFHYLNQHKDLQIDVVTSAIPTLYMPYDADLEPYAAGVNQLVSLRLTENRYINYIRNRLGLQETVFPDVKQSFHLQFKKAIKQLKEKPELIYSRSYPLSSAIMAFKLKNHYKIPWILHLSDPWAGSPLHKWSNRYAKRQEQWEMKCFEAADIIALTSIPTIEFYQKKYPALSEKFQFYPNVYENKDAAVAGSPRSRTGGKFRMVYTGGLAGTRSPGFLLEPLKKLAERNPGIVNNIEVIFAGEADGQNRAVFQHYSLPFVKWLGKLPFKEALKLQQSADYLVVIDSPITDAALSMFFPSKLLDYMLAQKRILAITTAGSATDRVMHDLKGDICVHGDIEAIGEAIQKTYYAFRDGDVSYILNNQPPRKYEAAFNADRLYHQIIKLLHV